MQRILEKLRQRRPMEGLTEPDDVVSTYIPNGISQVRYERVRRFDELKDKMDAPTVFRHARKNETQ